MAEAQMALPVNGTAPRRVSPAVAALTATVPAAPPATPPTVPSSPEPVEAPAVKRPARPPAKKAAKKAPAKKPASSSTTTARPTARKAKGRSVSEEHVFAVAGYAVALAAVLVSLSHMFEVAHLAGQSWRSFLLPVSVDGLALVSVMAVRRCRRQGLTPDRLVIGSLVLSVTASLAANVIASDPELVDEAHLRWVVGAWPPVAFLLAELVIKQWHRAGAGVPSTSRPGASPNPTKARGRTAS
jgi:hypothetical protein